MNLKHARRGLSVTLATIMAITSFSFALPSSAAPSPGSALYVGRDVYANAAAEALKTAIGTAHNVANTPEGHAALDGSPGLADFTRPNIIDWVHYVSRGSANVASGENLTGSTVVVKHVKSGVLGDRVDINGNDGSAKNGGNYADLGLFGPKYTDGVVLSSGDPVNSTTSVNMRRSHPAFASTNATATFTAPSANGQARTLEIYLAVNGGQNLTVTAAMNNIPVATVPSFDRRVEDTAAVSNALTGMKYVFTYTGDANEYPLVVTFTLAAADNANWSGIRPVAAVILNETTNTLNVTGGTATYNQPLSKPGAVPADQFLSGQVVTITANAAPFGQVFDAWTGADAALLNDVTSATATFTMPNHDVALVATYKNATTKTVTVTGGMAAEVGGSGGISVTTAVYAGSTVALVADAPPAGLRFKNWKVTNGAPVTFADPNAATTTFVMPDADVEIGVDYGVLGTAEPGIKKNEDPQNGTKKYNDFLFSKWSAGEVRHPWAGTTAFSSVSNNTAVPGVPQIEDNLSVPNVLDWMRFTNDGTGAKINRKSSANLLTATFGGTVSNSRVHGQNEERKNIRLTYIDGTSPAEDSSSWSVVRTGSTTAQFTAPSAEGIERTLDVYLTFQATAARTLTISATMPKQGGGQYTYTTTESLSPQNVANKISGRYAAKFSFTYAGDEGEAPLTVNFSLNNTSGNMGVHGVRLSEGAPAPQIYMTVPDLDNNKYAITVPDSLFQRRYFPVKVVDATGALVSDPEVTYSYMGVSANVDGQTHIPGVTLESDGMLYVRPNTAETMTIAVTASAAVNGTPVSVTRNVRIIKDAKIKDWPTRNAEDGPEGKNAADWKLFFNDDFDGPELDATAWVPQYLQSWAINKDNSEAKYEIVKDEAGNSYLALGSKEQRPDFSEGFNGTNDGGDQPIVALSSRDRHHQHLLEDGRGNALDPDLPDFDGLVTTKYGYFETRLRLPSTGDGAHFAWWMVGAQDDSHPTQALSGPKPSGTRYGAGTASGMYDFGPGSWGNYVFYTTDQGVEYDILEITADKNSPNGEFNRWLPVIHKNGSRSSPSNPTAGRWWAGSDVSTTPNPTTSPYGRYNYTTHTEDGYTGGRDAYQEFHVYGFEWDETGTKMYIDGHLVYVSSRTADYRMLTILSIYLGRNGEGDGYGHDHGYWPKEAMFDYFRIYKKKDPVPTSIVINGLQDAVGNPVEGRHNTSWDYFQQGSTVNLSATVLDQFGEPYDISGNPDLSIKWRFSDDIGGSKALSGGSVALVGGASVTYPAGYSATAMNGLTLNPDTGVLTVAADAAMNQDIFLTAYLADSGDASGYYGGKFTVVGEGATNEGKRNRAKFQETKHIKVSGETPKPHRIFFDNPVLAIAPGETLNVKATVYDQYNNPMPDQSLQYVLTKDVTLRATVNLSDSGITLVGSNLIAASNAVQGKQIMVRAQLNGDVYQNLALKVDGAPLADAEAPVISGQPSNGNYTLGDSATALTVTASVSDGGTLSYQWYESGNSDGSGGTAINGATSANYTPSTSVTGTTYYYVVITNTNPGATGVNKTAATTSSIAAVVVNSSVPPTGSGSGSGSSSSSGGITNNEDSNTADTTTTTKNEDGSTTSTVTNKTTGTVTETTVWPNGNKAVVETRKDGTVIIIETRDDVKTEIVTKPSGETTAKVTLPEDRESATITIPLKKTTSGTVAVLVNADGTETIMPKSVVTKDGVVLNVTESANIRIIDNSKNFSDVAASNWAYGAVQFAASRELMGGTGRDIFTPGGDMTRAMLFTVLARLNGQDTAGGATWYEKGLTWAVEKGISDGTAPEASITREQLAAMLYRYAGSPEAGEISLDGFSDAAKVSDWAKNAINWAVENGILTGKGGNVLDPTGNASRAEVAAMLQRFIENAM